MMNPFEKEVLTTGEVAKICNVAARTVSKWFDSGQIEGYRIPGSKDRRISEDSDQREDATRLGQHSADGSDVRSRVRENRRRRHRDSWPDA